MINTSTKMEFFFVCFHTTTDGLATINGSGKAGNKRLIAKPNGMVLIIIIIDVTHRLFLEITIVKARNSDVMMVIARKIDQNFERNFCLYINEQQNHNYDHNAVYQSISQQKCYNSSYKTLELVQELKRYSIKKTIVHMSVSPKYPRL